MHLKVLQNDIGLTLNEAKIYYAILKQNPATIEQITKETKVHRRNIYDVLDRLLDKGLVSKVFKNESSQYIPVNPVKLSEVLSQKQNRFDKFLPELIKVFEAQKIEETAYIYKGIQGFKNYLNEILKSKNFYSIGAKGEWFDPVIADFMQDFWQKKKEYNINSMLLFDNSAKSIPQIAATHNPSSYKFLKPEFDTDSVIDIFDDHIVIFSNAKPCKIDENITIFVIKNPLIAKSFIVWFKIIWNSHQN
jgi:sugar-specific transcriptional regulator TrmB